MPVSRTLARLRTVTTAAVGLGFLMVSAAATPLAQSTTLTGSVAAAVMGTSEVSSAATSVPPVATTPPAQTLTPAAPSTGAAAVAAATQASASGATKGSTIRSPTGAQTAAASIPDPTVKELSTAQRTTGTYAGWTTDWIDNFNVPIDQTKWGRYGWGYQVPGQGAMGRYLQPNTFTSNGIMTLRTQYVAGEWSSAGVSSGDFYSAAGGRWEVRAKFPVSKGIGYVFLLYPTDGSWPPEVDIAEGRVNGPQIMSTYHWGSNNSQVQSNMSNPDMSGWHTYGVILGTNTITYTFDGKPWATVTNSQVTTKKLWIGFQCGAMDPNGSAKAYETVDGGVPGPLTPAVSDIQIDWVAHYTKA